MQQRNARAEDVCHFSAFAKNIFLSVQISCSGSARQDSIVNISSRNHYSMRSENRNVKRFSFQSGTDIPATTLDGDESRLFNSTYSSSLIVFSSSSTLDRVATQIRNTHWGDFSLSVSLLVGEGGAVMYDFIHLKVFIAGYLANNTQEGYSVQTCVQDRKRSLTYWNFFFFCLPQTVC